MEYIKQKLPVAKGRIHKAGSAWRDGKEYDEHVIDEFLKHHAKFTIAILKVVEESTKSLILPMEKIDMGPVKPESRHFNVTARVKTRGTLLEKLRRMKTFPIENIQDISGVRFDGDITLGEQERIAEIFADDLKRAGAEKVQIKDLRSTPHSGYRAIHLHIHAPAGRAELQIRTAFQAKWANTYEVAADIFGRSIRYTEFGESIPEESKETISILHQVSNRIHEMESTMDKLQRPGLATGDEISARDRERIRATRSKTYDILELAHQKLAETRERLSNGEE